MIFLSEKSLSSDWVIDELFKAQELWSEKKLTQICPIIIQESITYNDKRIPRWLQDNYNLKYISRPTKAAQIIEERMIELAFERHPKLKERKNIFVGRNELIGNFEERMDDFEKNKPVCIVASGIKSVGRRSLIQHCIFKSNIKESSYPFPQISLNYDESIEDFILKVFDLGFDDHIVLDGMLTKTVEEKIDIAKKLVLTMQKMSDILFVEDRGSIISQEGEVAEWFSKLIGEVDISNKLCLCIISKNRLRYFVEDTPYSTKEKIYSLEVGELDKKERDGLLSRYLQFEGIEVELEDFRMISNLLTGYPEQVFYAVEIIKEKGIEELRKRTNELVEFNSKRASIMLKEYENDTDKLSLLAMLSEFDYIGIKFIYEIVEGEEKYLKYIDEFISNSFCEYVGVLKEYIRVNETIKDYIIRNNYPIDEHHKNNMSNHLKIFLNSMSMSEYDVPEYLFSLKAAMVHGEEIDEKHLVPSLYLKTMTELYNNKKNKEVIAFAYKALEKEAFMDKRIIFEIRYLLCSALAKLKDKRFGDEVRKISGANFYFLYGFYYRQIGKFDKALEMLEKSLDERKNFSKAKREKVQVYIGMQEFQAAKELAKENYLNQKDNAYHIQAYFSCLIKSEKNKENRLILSGLLEDLKKINTDVAKEMTVRCEAQFEAFYNENMEEALSLIDEAISMSSNIQYARLVKFEICERFDLLEQMEEIVKFFEQPELKNKYSNNIVSFRAILLAKNGELDKAKEYFIKGIKDYTPDAKEKFISRLERIVDEHSMIK